MPILVIRLFIVLSSVYEMEDCVMDFEQNIDTEASVTPTGGNKKKKKQSKAQTGVKNFFFNIWIWFKETAWIQVVLVVAVVFAIVISIPLIVRAATATDSDENIAKDYWNKYTWHLSDINAKAQDTSKEYTIVMFYTDDSGNQALSIKKPFTDYIFDGTNSFENIGMENNFYCINMNYDEENDDYEDDPYITTDQKTEIAVIYAQFYKQVLDGQASNFIDVNTGNKNVSRVTSGKSLEGITDMPTDAPIIAVYKNKADLDITTDMPVSLRYGFSATDASTVRKEFFATISVNFTYDEATNSFGDVAHPNYLHYDINNPNTVYDATTGTGTDNFIRYKK